MNNTILTDNKEIETLDLPSWWSDDFPCVATLLKTGFKGHRQLFAADANPPRRRIRVLRSPIAQQRRVFLRWTPYDNRSIQQRRKH